MQKERASKKQQELLSFVDGFIKGSGYGPSYREIMRALGYKSVSTVAVHVEGLIAKGYLRRKDNSARSLEVVTTRPGGTSPKNPLPLEAELLGYLQTRTLTPEQKSVVKEAMRQLGFTEITKALEEEVTANVESH